MNHASSTTAPDLSALQAELEGLMEEIASRTDCAPRLARIDAFAAQWSGAINPQLGHFLERRSYQKALDFLKA